MRSKKCSRVFIVGAPRSGTTLLQAFLAAHPKIYSLPETKFFVQLELWKAERFKLFANSSSVHPLKKLGMILAKPCTATKILTTPRSMVNAFVSTLDQHCRQQNCPVWVEKTPRHLHHIGTISRFVPNAQFLHILRSPIETVASLYERRRKERSVWKGPLDIDSCLFRWLEDVRISFKFLGHPNHRIVFYQDLIEQTQDVLSGVCRLLKIEYSHRMMTDRAKKEEELTLPHEHWKQKSFRSLFNSDHNDLTQSILHPQTLRYLRSELRKEPISRLLTHR